MFRVNRYSYARAFPRFADCCSWLALLAALAVRDGTRRLCAARPLASSKGGVANLEAKMQSRKGDVITADGDVDIRYGERSDHCTSRLQRARSSS